MDWKLSPYKCAIVKKKWREEREKEMMGRKEKGREGRRGEGEKQSKPWCKEKGGEFGNVQKSDGVPENYRETNNRPKGRKNNET